LLNKGSFRIADPGPLHAPIHSFSIRRNEKHQLLLETRAPADAKSSAPEYPSGILRLNTDTVELLNVSGIKATLVAFNRTTSTPEWCFLAPFVRRFLHR
jgi:hypothetical protein